MVGQAEAITTTLRAAQALQLLLDDPAYFGTMMMMEGICDGMVSGACHSTANTMRPALQLIKMARGPSLLLSTPNYPAR